MLAPAEFLWTRNIIRRLLTPWKLSAGRDPTTRRQTTESVPGRPQDRPGREERRRRTWSVGLPAIIHVLSQPLTALRGSLELGLLTEGNVVDYRLALKESLAQADNLVEVLASLRELMETEDLCDPPESISFKQLVEEVSEEMQVLANSRGLSLSLESKEEFYVRANSRCVRQAVGKVVHRAIERTPKGGTVLVSLSRSDRNACLRIVDQGPFARPGELDHLFEAPSLGILFSEAWKRGTLAWAIAKRTLEVQGGTVWVEGKLGEGCCFTACLPLAPPAIP